MSTCAAAIVSEAVSSAAAAFRKACVPEPELSAEYLMAAALGGPDGTRDRRATLSAAERRRLTDAERLAFEAMVAKRLDRMPVQMIVGEWDFHGVTLQVEPGCYPSGRSMQ